MIFGFFSVLSLIYGVGGFVVMVIFLSITLDGYRSKANITLLCSSAIFASVFYLAGYALHDGFNSAFVSSMLLNCSNIASIIFVQNCLVLLKLSDLEINEGDLLPTTNLKVKLFLSILCAVISYVHSYICYFPLVQVPFYAAISYIVTMFGLRLHSLMPLNIQPFWIFA